MDWVGAFLIVFAGGCQAIAAVESIPKTERAQSEGIIIAIWLIVRLALKAIVYLFIASLALGWARDWIWRNAKPIDRSISVLAASAHDSAITLMTWIIPAIVLGAA